MLLNTREKNLADSGEKPSTLMSRMLTMLGDAETNVIFVWLFLEQLPENISNILMQKDLTYQKELAREADRMWTPNHGMVNAVASTSEPYHQTSPALLMQSPDQPKSQ